MKIKLLSYILAVIFLLSGGAKLAGLSFEVTAFERWGYPLWFMYFTGSAEVAGGLALAANLLRQFAAPALALLMVGAVATHLLHQEWMMLVIASSIMLSAAYLAKLLWPNIVLSKQSELN